jgi:hypothetical protein
VVGILTFKHITETHISVGIYDGTGTIEAKQYPDENVPVRRPPPSWADFSSVCVYIKHHVLERAQLAM